MSWDAVETARCARCGVYGTDLVRGPDGNGYCCGVPRFSPASEAPEAHAVVAPVTNRMERATRLVIGTMLLLTLAFPLAACCSQL